MYCVFSHTDVILPKLVQGSCNTVTLERFYKTKKYWADPNLTLPIFKGVDVRLWNSHFSFSAGPECGFYNTEKHLTLCYSEEEDN